MKVETGLHHIRKHILRELAYIKKARFRDLRPKNIDSNLYAYHLKQLIKDQYVEHMPGGTYRLSPLGLRYIDHVSLETFEPRWQPKILTVLYVENEWGDILMWPKHKQPFIGRWSLPSGKIHYEDASVESAALRETTYFAQAGVTNLQLCGTMHYRAFIGDDVVTNTIAHTFRATMRANDMIHQTSAWIDLSDIPSLKLSPGTLETIRAVQTKQPLFFESHDIDY